MLVYIVIPCFNSAQYLNQCLSSLLFQTGKFKLHVHIQDGKSQDATLAIAEKWQSLIERQQILDPTDIKITISSEPDRGIYDAVTKGFARIDSSPDIIMTWLGSDDLLVNGSLATITRLFQEERKIAWLTGCSQTIDANDCLFSPWQKPHFSRRNILAGLQDGRTFGFIQQEGTFWRSDLYFQVGGLNPNLKYAGDFDLWRKFAYLEKLYTLDFPLVIFRYRAGQTSSNKEHYYAEVESIKQDFSLLKIENSLNLAETNDYLSSAMVTRFPIEENYLVQESHYLPLTPMQSMSKLNSPSPENNIFTPYYWTFGRCARAQVDVFGLPVLYKLMLKVRNFHPQQVLKIYDYQKKLLGSFNLHSDFAKSQILTFKYDFSQGDTSLELQLDQCLNLDSKEGPLGIIIEDLIISVIKYLI